MTRCHLLLLAAASGAALARPGRAAAQDRNAPESLRRGGTPLQFRAWERYPAANIPGLNRYLDQNPGGSIEWVSTRLKGRVAGPGAAIKAIVYLTLRG